MKLKKIFFLVVFLILTGCASTTIHTSKKITLPSDARWAVLPIVDHSGTPYAGNQVGAILEGLLRTKGISHIRTFKGKSVCDKLMICPAETLPMQEINRWARLNGINYAFTGTVNEWRYKVGLDGEPAVNVTLSLIDMKNKKVIWSSVGSKIGGSRSSLDGIAQNLLNSMLSAIVVN